MAVICGVVGEGGKNKRVKIAMDRWEQETTRLFVPGLFVGMTGENSHTSSVGVKCPVQKSTNHRLQERKELEIMSGSEREKVVDKHKLCLER